jgi:hypothetical protein
MIATPKTQTPLPGSIDLAEHLMLWGHPLPKWDETGLVYVEGSHWTNATYDALTIWLGRSLDAMRLWIYGPTSHRTQLHQRKRISKACAKAHAEGEEGFRFAEAVDKILPGIVLTQTELDAMEGIITHADRARKKLWAIANGSDPKTKPHTINQLAAWVTKHHVELVLRLGAVDLVPKPPEAILPRTMPKPIRGRMERLNTKPSADPSHEDAFK